MVYNKISKLKKSLRRDATIQTRIVEAASASSSLNSIFQRREGKEVLAGTGDASVDIAVAFMVSLLANIVYDFFRSGLDSSDVQKPSPPEKLSPYSEAIDRAYDDFNDAYQAIVDHDNEKRHSEAKAKSCLVEAAEKILSQDSSIWDRAFEVGEGD